MKNFCGMLSKGWNILLRRIQTQGIGITFIWLYARGLPAITGIPLLQYSRVTPDLFVGPQFRQAGKKYLEGLGITSSINMRIEFDDASKGLALEEYLYLPTIDDAAPSFKQLDTGVEFIRRMINSNKKVYIHCGAGVGRAPTMAAAYLMSEGLSLEGSLKLIKQVRPFITITQLQLKQLQLYENLLRNQEKFLSTTNELKGIEDECS